ncbi:hypothetical protein ACTFIR_000020 [Dictyostelium discoideum]
MHIISRNSPSDHNDDNFGDGKSDDEISEDDFEDTNDNDEFHQGGNHIRRVNEDVENEYQYDSESSICPLTHEPIVIPAKTIFCQHNQCFDLMAYITTSCHTGLWICPVCDIDGGPFNLIIYQPVDKHLHNFYDVLDFIGE